MKIIRVILFSVISVSLLAGCRSHKSVVRGGGALGAESAYGRIDYSDEVVDGMGRDLVAEARGWLGTPYRYGGADRRGTDCSGLVMELYRMVCATRIPRTTTDQKSYCTKVARNKARVGDLMFFGSSKNSGSVSHVGLYIGKGEMIHASSSRGVMVSNVDTGYWGDRFQCVGRVDNAYDAWASTTRGKKSRKNNDDNRSPNVTPIEVPTPGNTVPAPVGEIAYNEVGSVFAPQPAPQVRAPLPQNNVVPVVRNDDERTVIASKASDQNTEADVTASIDLLDLIINHKVDSIFSNQFMD